MDHDLPRHRKNARVLRAAEPGVLELRT